MDDAAVLTIDEQAEAAVRFTDGWSTPSASSADVAAEIVDDDIELSRIDGREPRPARRARRARPCTRSRSSCGRSSSTQPVGTAPGSTSTWRLPGQRRREALAEFARRRSPTRCSTIGRRAGARADEPARPQGRARHRRRARRGRRRSRRARSPGAGWSSARPDATSDPRAATLARRSSSEARDHGFLGPGPVAAHLEHARGFAAAAIGGAGPLPGAFLDLGTGGGRARSRARAGTGPRPGRARRRRAAPGRRPAAGGRRTSASTAGSRCVRPGPRTSPTTPELRERADLVAARSFGRAGGDRRDRGAGFVAQSVGGWWSASRRVATRTGGRQPELGRSGSGRPQLRSPEAGAYAALREAGRGAATRCPRPTRQPRRSARSGSAYGRRHGGRCSTWNVTDDPCTKRDRVVLSRAVVPRGTPEPVASARVDHGNGPSQCLTRGRQHHGSGGKNGSR